MILDRIVLDQLVRKTVLFCDEKKPDMVGIEAVIWSAAIYRRFGLPRSGFDLECGNL